MAALTNEYDRLPTWLPLEQRGFQRPLFSGIQADLLPGIAINRRPEHFCRAKAPGQNTIGLTGTKKHPKKEPVIGQIVKGFPRCPRSRGAIHGAQLAGP